MNKSVSIVNSLAEFNQSMAGKYPVSELLANHIKSLISMGKLGPGTEIPGVRELAASLPLSYVNIQKALAICSQEGLLTRCPGRKTVVASNRKLEFKKLIYLVIQQTEEELRIQNYASGEYFSALTSGIQKELAEHGTSLMVSSVTGDVQERLFLERLSVNPPDIVLISRSKNTALISGIQKRNIPVALIEPDIYNDEDLPLISNDHDKYAQDIVNRMMLEGCRSAALVFRDTHKWLMKSRFDSLMRRLEEKKISVPAQWIKLISPSCVENALKDILSSSKKPDSLILSAGVKWKTLKPIMNKIRYSKDMFIALYTDEEECDGVSYFINVNPWQFGISIGKLIINNFLKNGHLSPGKYLIN